MSHQNVTPGHPPKRDLTPYIIAWAIIGVGLIGLISFLVMRLGPTLSTGTSAMVPVDQTAPTGAEQQPAGPGQAQPPGESATEAEEPVVEVLEPGELSVRALPTAIGEYELVNFQGLYTYAKPGAAPNTGVSVTDTGGDFLLDELLDTLPDAQVVGDGRGVCGDADGLGICYLDLTDYGLWMVQAMDAETPSDEVVLIAETVLRSVG